MYFNQHIISDNKANEIACKYFHNITLLKSLTTVARSVKGFTRNIFSTDLYKFVMQMVKPYYTSLIISQAFPVNKVPVIFYDVI